MKQVCADGPVVRGIDIYHGNMISDVTKLKPAGIEYAFLKAFENSVDPKFQTRWASMKDHGIIRGAYDFFHPGHDPLDQANRFLKAVGPLSPGDLPCVLDWESTDGVPASHDRENALIWLHRVKDGTGKTPIIYTGPYFAQALALDAQFAQYPLWVAHYGVKCPLVPAPWKKWTFWQTSETGSVPGIPGHTDLDVFNGTLEDLRKFVNS